MFAPIAVAATIGTVALAFALKKMSSAPYSQDMAQPASKQAEKRRKKKAAKKGALSEIDRLAGEIDSLAVSGSSKDTAPKDSKKKKKSKAKKSANKVPAKVDEDEAAEADDEMNLETFAGVKSSSAAAAAPSKKTVASTTKTDEDPAEKRRKKSISTDQAKEVFNRAAGGLAVSHTEYVTEFNDDEWTQVESNYKKKDTEVLRFKDFSFGGIMKMAKQAGILTQSSPRVDIDKHSCTISISGEPSEVSGASKAFEEILDTLQAQADAKRDEDVALGEKWHIVAGPKFENIKRIQTETGARLQLAKETNVLTVSGLHAQVDAALVQVNLALNPPAPEHRASLPISKYQALTIIGPGGSRIREIQKETGAKLDLDGDRNAESRVLTISGHDQSQVIDANTRVMNILREYSHSATIPISRDGISLLLYNDGAELKELRKSYPDVNINLDRDAEKVTLQGEQQALGKVQDKIYLVISSPPQTPKLKDGEKFEAIELGGATATVIGKGYSNIKNIKASCGVEMDIPPTTQQAWIWGKAAKVQKAKDEVLGLIKKYNDKMAVEKNAQDSRNQFITYQENAVNHKEKGLPWGGSAPTGW